MDRGLLEEVRTLAAPPRGYVPDQHAQALGYRELLTHLEGGVPLDDAVARSHCAYPGICPTAAGLVSP